MASFNEFLGSLDTDAGKRGKQFEHFVKWFLKNDPEWVTQVDQVWLWDEYPDSWGRDCGIDLVFKHKNGENWAVQAKCYAPTTSITKADVDSFISESNRDGIDKRLLIATTDLIGANAKQVCDAQDKPVTRFLLSHFEDADIEYPATLDELPKAKRKDKPEPREHQIEAIEAVASSFKDVERGQLIMACGTGKTFTTLWIKERLGVESTLVLLPSLGLLSQTLHEWTLAANQEFQVLCVCSDDSVGKRGSDEAVHSIADLAFPVTSSAGDIKAFLSSSGKKVIFSTYQSSPLIAEAQSDKTVPAFDLAIADEAHRCAGKVSGDFSTILDGEKIRAKKRLFTTATPRTYSSSVKKAAEDRGVEVVGMDDEAVFGKQLFTLNFGEAIKRGLLTDYQVVIIGVDNPTISAWIESRELLKADSDIEMDAESLAAQVGLLKAIKDYDLHRLISFHSRVSRAEEFSQDIHKVLDWIDEKHKPSGELRSDFVSGEMPTDKRRRKLSQLKTLKENQRGLLTNARCLSEGVDVPSLDGVAFIDPRSSQIDIIQAVGRAIRLSENKKSGTIVLPVFIANSVDPERALEEGNFKPVWDALNALKAHDDLLADELSEIRTQMGRKKSRSFNSGFTKITLDLPQSVSKEFIESLKTKLVEQVSASWDFWFGLLEAFKEEYGHALVPHRMKYGGNYDLGSWVLTQRQNKERMSQERRDRLSAFDGWSWNALEDKWATGFAHLSEYVRIHGHALVPTDTVMPDGYRLGTWVGSQRTNKDSLSSEKMLLLSSLPRWAWSATDDRWKDFYEALVEFSIVNGDCLVPIKHITDQGIKLGIWVTHQRSIKDDLPADKREKLESINGWSWDPIGEKWTKGYRYLHCYSEENGTSQAPKSYKTDDGFSLGNWVSNQRKNKKILSSESISLLEKLPNWSWDPFSEKWITGFNELSNYVLVHGSADIEANALSPNGYAVGRWVQKQRQNKSRLKQEQLQKLESLKGWVWNAIEDSWESSFIELERFLKTTGSLVVPEDKVLESGINLGRWISKQRSRKHSLSPEKIKRLESLNGWVWDPYEEKWNTGFKHLQKFALEKNHCKVPQGYRTPDDFPLGTWVAKQRSTRSKLRQDRYSLLDQLEGWVWTIKK